MRAGKLCAEEQLGCAHQRRDLCAPLVVTARQRAVSHQCERVERVFLALEPDADCEQRRFRDRPNGFCAQRRAAPAGIGAAEVAQELSEPMLKSGAERAVDQSEPVCLGEQRFGVSARIGPEAGIRHGRPARPRQGMVGRGRCAGRLDQMRCGRHEQRTRGGRREVHCAPACSPASGRDALPPMRRLSDGRHSPPPYRPPPRRSASRSTEPRHGPSNVSRICRSRDSSLIRSCVSFFENVEQFRQRAQRFRRRVQPWRAAERLDQRLRQPRFQLDSVGFAQRALTGGADRTNVAVGQRQPARAAAWATDWARSAPLARPRCA